MRLMTVDRLFLAAAVLVGVVGVAGWVAPDDGAGYDDAVDACRRAVAGRLPAGPLRWIGGEAVIAQGAAHAYVDGKADVAGGPVAYRCLVDGDGTATVEYPG